MYNKMRLNKRLPNLRERDEFRTTDIYLDKKK